MSSPSTSNCLDPLNITHNWTSRHNLIRTWAESISINNLMIITRSHVKLIPSTWGHEVRIFRILIKVRAKVWTNLPSLGWLEIRNENVGFSWSDAFSSNNETCPSMFSVFFSITSTSNTYFKRINIQKDWIVNRFLCKDVLKRIVSSVIPII